MKFFTHSGVKSLGRFGLAYFGGSAAGAAFVGGIWGGTAAALSESPEQIIEKTKNGAFVGGFPVTYPWAIARAIIANEEEKRTVLRVVLHQKK